MDYDSSYKRILDTLYDEIRVLEDKLAHLEEFGGHQYEAYKDMYKTVISVYINTLDKMKNSITRFARPNN